MQSIWDAIYCSLRTFEFGNYISLLNFKRLGVIVYIKGYDFLSDNPSRVSCDVLLFLESRGDKIGLVWPVFGFGWAQ